MLDKIIPPQIDGDKSDNIYSVTCNNIEDAISLYQKSVNKLLNVNSWEKISKGIIKAGFKLCDRFGNEVDRLPQQGDHFKIDIPGPGSIGGEGYDWVKIENFFTDADKINDTDLISINVRPASCPLNNKDSIAHFFSDSSTSTFLIKREKTIVTAQIHGRNEKPNEQSENTVDVIRNKVVATGAMLSFSDIQWKQLAIGFLS